MKKTIYLDLDDVLCDFAGGVCKAFGMSRKEFEARRNPGEWCHLRTLGVTEQDYHYTIRGKGEKFWCDLEPKPWLIELIHLVNSITKEWFILTSPMDFPACYSGKASWAKRYLGKLAHDRLIISKHKWMFSKPNSLLIDDRWKNLLHFEFNADGAPRGGHGLLFPTKGNALHDMEFDPIPHIRENLNAFNMQKRKRRIPTISEYHTGEWKQQSLQEDA